VTILRTEHDHEERLHHVHGGKEVEMEELGEPIIHDVDASHPDHVSQTRRYSCPDCGVEVVLDLALNMRYLRG
jgi:hypothetical protein